MSKRKNYKNWEECIHIGACRRLSKIYNAKMEQPMSRGCGVNCSMFKSRTALIRELLSSGIDDFIDNELIQKEQ